MFTTLISPAQLAAHIDDPQWIVFDCRFDLAETAAGRREYAQSHIPGARYVHLDEHLAGAKTGTNGRHPLPDADSFAATMAGFGLRRDVQAVAYDASGGFYAARLWWMLRWAGHMSSAVLDGGWKAWGDAKLPVTGQLPHTEVGDFSASKRATTVDADFVLSRIGKPGSLVVDARSPDRFRGENETLDPVGGHIPGAANRFFKQNLTDSGSFKSGAELRREYAELLGAIPPASVIHQCGSGVTACHNLLAMEIAGLTGSSLYPGSWSEWCSNRERPIAR